MADPRARRLALLGFLTLFLELALIRFLAGNIWNLGYFPNLVLLAVFVGMGVGFVFHQRVGEERSRSLFAASTLALLALVGFVHFLRPVVPGFGRWSGEIGGEVYYTDAPTAAGGESLLAFGLWFCGVALVFALLAQRTAKLFRLFPPLTAYTLDIAGSCAGIAAFMAVSWIQLPAYGWFLLALPLFLACHEGPLGRRALAAAPLLAVAALAFQQDRRLLADPAYRGPLEVRWSPYQKVEYATEPDGQGVLYVNGVAHQGITGPEDLPRSYYQVPYLLRARRAGLPPYRSVLVIGAGAGNDVAAALANGAAEVDAVEIDPVIARFGREKHPARPYDDPRVRLTVDDGRAFLTACRRRYDLIVFALTDSVVKVSPVAQLRLENYIYTRESVRRATELLAPGGDLLLYNFYRRPWVLEKNQALVVAATGRFPATIYQSGDFAMLLAGQAAQGPAVPLSVEPASDDWPFPYLPRRGVPGLYLRAMACLALAIGLLAVLLQGSTRGAGESLRLREDLPAKLAFLVMGMAFLLLETKGVIQFSLLFGTTWLNSSLVFLAVLALVLLANLLAGRTGRASRLLGRAWMLLVGSCLLAIVVPPATLLHVRPAPLRFLAAAVLIFAPIFFANLIFSVAFRDQRVAEHMFGWNLVGATLGGLLEYTSMAVGYTALAGVVALCYTVVCGLLLLASRQPRLRGARAAAVTGT